MFIEAMRKMTLTAWRKEQERCLGKRSCGNSKLSKRAVVRVQAVIGRLIGLAGDTADGPW